MNVLVLCVKNKEDCSIVYLNLSNDGLNRMIDHLGEKNLHIVYKSLEGAIYRVGNVDIETIVITRKYVKKRPELFDEKQYPKFLSKYQVLYKSYIF